MAPTRAQSAPKSGAKSLTAQSASNTRLPTSPAARLVTHTTRNKRNPSGAVRVIGRIFIPHLFADRSGSPAGAGSRTTLNYTREQAKRQGPGPGLVQPVGSAVLAR